MHIRQEVRADVVLIADQLGQIERAAIEEAVPSGAKQEGVWAAGVNFLEDGCFGRRENAIQPPQHGERQYDAPVFGLFIIAAQQIGDRPDKIRKRLVIQDAALQRCLMHHQRSSGNNCEQPVSICCALFV